MAYNKAKEEKKWRLWKEAKEKQLRNLGVNEDDIEKLRIHDWAIFNSDRRYYQRVQETGTYLASKFCGTLTKFSFNCIKGFLVNDCRIEVITKIVTISHHSFCTGMKQAKPGFLCSIGE